MDTLRIGIPNGSMVDPKRGGLKELLDRARIYSKNIGTNKPPEITNIPWLEARVGRPQELPALAASGYCDVFFCGDDWAKEWELRGTKSEKLLGLGIGKVRIVVARPKYGGRGWPNNRDENIVATEYPSIARDFLKDGEVFYKIMESVGCTEAKVMYGIADLVVEAMQSGITLSNYGLEYEDYIMESECSLYRRNGLDKEQIKQAERIAMMLEGAINAQGKELVTFNVGNENLDKVLAYIRENQLFANEETVISGEKMSEITLELSTTDRQKPLIDVIGDLKDLGATAIEGTPLSYSIK